MTVALQNVYISKLIVQQFHNYLHTTEDCQNKESLQSGSIYIMEKYMAANKQIDIVTRSSILKSSAHSLQ